MEIRRRSPAPPITVESQVYRVNMPDAQPRNILEEIVWHKETEVEKLREQLPLSRLKQQVQTLPPPRDFLAALTSSPHPVSLIAEVKKASPSRGVLREEFDPVAIAQAYESAGASCLSVLTDAQFFQGSGDSLRKVKQSVSLPVLCKEFVLYSYQILWARSLGADAILLIAALLSDADLTYFLKLIHQLGMTALVEVHTLAELDRVLAIPHLTLLGINNRDLTTFNVDLDTTQHLITARRQRINALGLTVVSESGIHSAHDLTIVHDWGVRSVLVGEALVKAPDPAAATRALLGQS